MKIHLVGGFLGSGKTTTIANSCKILSDKGITTSVITNDQGDYLVDSRFIQYSEIPFAEVTGGCFCCNYNQLDTQISNLKNKYNPSVIFAEFVGSCTDLVATVLKPLTTYRKVEDEQVTFSTVVDSQLFLAYIEGKELPFTLETRYIWEKQIEEAEVLIINKIDLISTVDLDKLKLISKEMFPSKQLLFQNSFDNDSLNNWIDIITNINGNQTHRSIDIDYAKYGIGEANLAWLDEEIEITTDNELSVEYAYDFINNITEDIVKKGVTIGHLKYFLVFNDKSVKISHTTIADKQLHETPVYEKSGKVDLLVNARIQTTPDELKQILFDNLKALKSKPGVVVNEKFLSYFKPDMPKPTHRME
jgi:Ni2+-binding GTPase involved in maturation of urease and hydrogenase